MKRITLVIVITISILSSCSKSSTLSDKVDEAALTAVMSSKDYGQLKVNYALLKPAEKMELWNRHIEYFINNRNLTSEQLSFVIDFKNKWVVKSLFEENSPILTDFTLALPQIKYKAQSLLGVPDAFSLLINVTSDKGYYGYSESTNHVATNATRTTESSNDCSCSQTDSYCNVGSCRDNGCTTSSLGCGTLFLFKCNGVCSLL
jgi:hypothetical protein